jgi:hypothetical protein
VVLSDASTSTSKKDDNLKNLLIVGLSVGLGEALIFAIAFYLYRRRIRSAYQSIKS